MDDLQGTILFATVGLPYFAFDVFSTPLPPQPLLETRHTDSHSANYNASSTSTASEIVVFVSERTGSSQLFLSSRPDPLPTHPNSLFHDRPQLRNGLLFFVSAHEPPAEPFKSWAAVYSTRLAPNPGPVQRLTPTGFADLSPAVSTSGDFIAVASYGDGPWKGDFRELETDIVVFPVNEPKRRTIVCRNGGWPAWDGDSMIFFHRKCEDGWWSVFRIEVGSAGGEAERITPPGVHAFTPAASGAGKRIAVATRRKGRKCRHVEMFDLISREFCKVTELLNYDVHHYNPFFSGDSERVGYHRFRGEDSEGENVAPYLQRVKSGVEGIGMMRILGTFPSFSPDGRFIAVNGDFMESPGLMILRADGSKRWTVVKTPGAFYTAWSPAEKGVIYTSVGPIFESIKANVQIVRVTFNLDDLKDENDEIDCQVKILTRGDTGNNAFPSCSPDGKFLVFRSGRSGYKNLYILDAVNGEGENGEGIRQITEGDWIDTMPAWSPDGELIAFSSNQHDPSNPAVFSIYLVRPDGTGLKRVPVAGPDGSAYLNRERINHVCFSPDSKWLLFTANLGAIVAEPISMPNQFQPYGDLYICRLDGTDLTRLTFNGYENGTPAWHSNNLLESGLASLSLGAVAGEKLRGQFDEPLWLTCDIE